MLPSPKVVVNGERLSKWGGFGISFVTAIDPNARPLYGHRTQQLALRRFRQAPTYFSSRTQLPSQATLPDATRVLSRLHLENTLPVLFNR